MSSGHIQDLIDYFIRTQIKNLQPGLSFENCKNLFRQLGIFPMMISSVQLYELIGAFAVSSQNKTEYLNTDQIIRIILAISVYQKQTNRYLIDPEDLISKILFLLESINFSRFL